MIWFGTKAVHASQTSTPRTFIGTIRARQRALRPNPSLNPRRATAGGVSLVRGARSIIAYQAYAARLRARG